MILISKNISVFHIIIDKANILLYDLYKENVGRLI